MNGLRVGLYFHAKFCVTEYISFIREAPLLLADFQGGSKVENHCYKEYALHDLVLSLPTYSGYLLNEN